MHPQTKPALKLCMIDPFDLIKISPRQASELVFIPYSLFFRHQTWNTGAATDGPNAPPKHTAGSRRDTCHPSAVPVAHSGKGKNVSHTLSARAGPSLVIDAARWGTDATLAVSDWYATPKEGGPGEVEESQMSQSSPIPARPIPQEALPERPPSTLTPRWRLRRPDLHLSGALTFRVSPCDLRRFPRGADPNLSSGRVIKWPALCRRAADMGDVGGGGGSGGWRWRV